MVDKMNRAAALWVAAFLLAGTTPAAHADGSDVFGDNCLVCHAPEAGVQKTGPSLAGIVGRKSGNVDGFPYSDAMAKANLVWTKPMLNNYLTNPQGVVAGTKMLFPGLKNAKERSQLIDYLATLKP
jgi:cytochrome c